MDYFLPKTVQINGKIVNALLKRHASERPRFDKLRDYYQNSERITRFENGKIITRTGYAKYITRLNAGYLIGNAVEYQASEGVDLTPLLDNFRRQNIAMLDKRLAKDCSIYGRAYERFYSDEAGEIRSARVDVRNAILVRDTSVSHDKLFGLVFEEIRDDLGKVKAGEWALTVLYADRVEEYLLKGSDLKKMSETPHIFGEVPMVEFRNDDERAGDFESVLTDIDAYNILKSDRLGDRRKLADAILAVSGARLDAESKADLMESMVVNLPDNAKMEYISKTTDENGADILRRNINDDIHKISMTPDMSDSNFIGNSSGVALAYKLLPFMMNNADKRREFEAGLFERLRVYLRFMGAKKEISNISTDEVDIIFKHNLPKNDLEMSQIINNLIGTGIADKSTLAAQLSFIQNAEEIVALAKREVREDYERESDGYGTLHPTGTLNFND